MENNNWCSVEPRSVTTISWKSNIVPLIPFYQCLTQDFLSVFSSQYCNGGDLAEYLQCKCDWTQLTCPSCLVEARREQNTSLLQCRIIFLSFPLVNKRRCCPVRVALRSLAQLFQRFRRIIGFFFSVCRGSKTIEL